jgi:hypothetical protein
LRGAGGIYSPVFSIRHPIPFPAKATPGSDIFCSPENGSQYFFSLFFCKFQHKDTFLFCYNLKKFYLCPTFAQKKEIY